VNAKNFYDVTIVNISMWNCK